MVRLAVETGMLTYSFADLGSDSLYGHLYKCIRNDILKGVLAPGTRLPSKRAFAKNLGISKRLRRHHRKAVDAAGRRRGGHHHGGKRLPAADGGRVSLFCAEKGLFCR